MKSGILKLFGVALFAYIIFKIDFNELLSIFLNINFIYYSVGIFFLAIWFIIRTIKWKILISSAAIEINNRLLINIMAKGVFLGVVTPGKLGEFWRAKYLSEQTGASKGKSMYTVFVDRLVDLLVLGFIAIFGLLAIYLKLNLQLEWKFYILVAVVLISLFSITLKVLGIEKISRIFINFLFPVSWRERATSFLTEFDKGLASLNQKKFLIIFSLSLLYYLVATLVYYFTALALGIVVPFWYMFFTIAIVWIMLMLPISFFGLGTREAGFIYFFSLIGISAPAAVAFSLLALISSVLLSLPGAVIFLKRKKS